MEEQSREHRKEKPHSTRIVERMRKETLSEREHKLIVGIPVIVGIRPIAVEPRLVAIASQVEHVLVAVGIGCVSHGRPSIPPPAYLPEVGLNFMRDRKSPSAPYQVFLFSCDNTSTHRRKS